LSAPIANMLANTIKLANLILVEIMDRT